MSLLARLRPRAPQRSVAWGGQIIPSYPSGIASFADVMAQGAGVSLQKVAIWSSIDLLSSLGSELPWDAFRGSGDDAVKVAKPSYMEDPAGDGYGYEDWAFQLLQSWLTTGNVFGQVLDRDRRGGFPTQVSLWPRDAVSVWLDNGVPKWSVQGRSVGAEEMWHNRVYPVAGSLLGLSPIENHMVTIGQGLAASRFGLQWFTDGAHPTAILRNTEAEIDEGQAKAVKARWMAVLAGSREPAVMGRGWEHMQVQVSANESQFLETTRYTEAMCCRIYGPGIAELLGYNDEKSMTYANVVDRRVDFLTLSGNKWLRRLERVIGAMLPRGQFAKINRNALLETNALDRFKAYELALKNKWMVVNQVRRLEDMPAVPWGDTPNETNTGGAGPTEGQGDGTDAA